MPVKYPFDEHSTVEDLKRHPWPDPKAADRVAGVAESARELHGETEYAVILQVPSQVFSFGEALCGSEVWFIKLATDPKFADYLLSIGVDFEIAWATELLQLVGENVDIVGCSDEFSGQDRPSISPRMYRSIVKPHQKRLFDAVRAQTAAKLWMHSSGNIYSVIGDFIDMGLDILNPVHVSCTDMGDTARLKREFGNDIAFWGAIDTQSVLAFGTPDEVRDEVRRRIDDLAPGGGYVISSIQNIPNGTPSENVCALFETALEYGRYS
jgi:uroporphyrinogen decarboxylase